MVVLGGECNALKDPGTNSKFSAYLPFNYFISLYGTAVL